jgi:hypothetical protein
MQAWTGISLSGFTPRVIPGEVLQILANALHDRSIFVYQLLISEQYGFSRRTRDGNSSDRYD